MKALYMKMLCAALAVLSADQAGAFVPRIAAGQDYTLVLRSDGTLWGWGSNGYGQLAIKTVAALDYPQARSGLNDVSAIAPGIALKADGTAWMLGSHRYYNYVLRQTFFDACTMPGYPCAMAGLQGVTALAGGAGYFAVVRNDGTVWGWGDNYGGGTIGNGVTETSGTPAPVPGLSGMSAVSVGYGHALALKNDGTVWGWGYNIVGQLGTPIVGSALPLAVENLTDVVAIAAGFQQSLALKSDGTVWNWGGIGGMQVSRPVQVNLPRIVAIATEDYAGHSLALDAEGNVWAWGRNDYGQLGTGDKTDSATPVRVSGLSGVVAIAAGAWHSAAILQDGTVWIWGKTSKPSVASIDQCEFVYQDTHGPYATGKTIVTQEPCAKLPRQVLDVSGKAFSVTAQTPPSVTETLPGDAERLFNYLEGEYPYYLSTRGPTCQAAGYVCRYYAATNAYIGTRDSKLYYLGPESGQQILELGGVADWLDKAKRAGW